LDHGDLLVYWPAPNNGVGVTPDTDPMILTEPQRDLFVWMASSGETSFLLEGMFGPHDSLLAGPGGEGKDRDVSASDVRELAAMGLIRQTSEKGYDLTNAGRMFYQELLNPARPEEPRRVGF
jgi:hypothetical protein